MVLLFFLKTMLFISCDIVYILSRGLVNITDLSILCLLYPCITKLAARSRNFRKNCNTIKLNIYKPELFMKTIKNAWNLLKINLLNDPFLFNKNILFKLNFTNWSIMVKCRIREAFWVIWKSKNLSLRYMYQKNI